jgi:hypothetical protein
MRAPVIPAGGKPTSRTWEFKRATWIEWLGASPAVIVLN